MAEHLELVIEMEQIEKMTTQERLKLAKRRRLQQLKKWNQREKEYITKKKKEIFPKENKKSHKVHFVPSVMLLEAAARNDVEEVKRLLMQGVTPDSINEDGLTALHQCCIDNSEEMMKLLIDFGANVNAKDSEQWTPLHAASTCGHLSIVKYLIFKRANLLAVNADGNMPYDICDDDATLDYIENEMAKKGITQEMIDDTRVATENQMLLDLKNLVAQGESLNFKDKKGSTFLHIAAANGYLSVMEYLLENHVTVDVSDEDLWQPIHAAACWGHPDAIEMLVEAGANINAKTKNGETPYDISEDIDVRERIMQLKFELETKRGSQRVRRSHSQNTRSQSIRRTSIREKVLISRREAREEALLRQEKEASSLDDEEIKNFLKTEEENISNSDDVILNDIDITFLPIDGKDTFQRFKSKSEQVDSVKRSTLYRDGFPLLSSDENRKQTDASLQTMETTVQQKTGQSVNVEIHVTVNTTPTYGLSDLKQQMCDEHSSTLACNDKSQNGLFYNQPPSPSTRPQKFRGDSLEVVGEQKRKKGCCHLI